MRILLSNDDGVFAPGLEALYEVLRDRHELFVVAPDRDLSAASKSLTLSHPIRARELNNGFISVQGTPTDCVHLALTELIKPAPDLVIAGINAGPNLGDDVLYSGTVAAATEGYFFGVSSIAVSLYGVLDVDSYNLAAVNTFNIVECLQQNPLEKNVILNINIPDEDHDSVEVTRLGARHRSEPMIKTHDPRGHAVYWVGPPSPEQDAGPGTDFYAVKSRRISITPLQMDLTRYNILKEITHWANKLEM